MRSCSHCDTRNPHGSTNARSKTVLRRVGLGLADKTAGFNSRGDKPDTLMDLADKTAGLKWRRPTPRGTGRCVLCSLVKKRHLLLPGCVDPTMLACGVASHDAGRFHPGCVKAERNTDWPILVIWESSVSGSAKKKRKGNHVRRGRRRVDVYILGAQREGFHRAGFSFLFEHFSAVLEYSYLKPV